MAEKKVILIVIRHAPTDDNRTGNFMGRLNVPCSEEGLAEARQTAASLGSLAVGWVFASPLKRCLSTCDAFMWFQRDSDDRLAERGLGEWEGLSKDDLKRKVPQGFLRTGQLDPNFCPPRGEPLREFSGRLIAFLGAVQKCGHEKVAVVTHNGVIRMLRFLLGHRAVRLASVFAKPEPHLSPVLFDLDAGRLRIARKRAAKLGNPAYET